MAGTFATLKGAIKIESLIKDLGGLKKALPTVKSAAGVGAISAGLMEIKQGNYGLAAMLIATGTGLVAVNNGLTKFIKSKKGTGEKTASTVEDTVSGVSEAKGVSSVSKASKAFSTIGSVAKKIPGAEALGKVAKKVPVVGTAATLIGAGTTITLSSNKKKAAMGATGSIAGGIAGAKLGATAGGAIGSIAGPAGTAVGAGIGGIAGGIGGSIGGEKFFDWVYKETGPAMQHIKKGLVDVKKDFSGLGKMAQSSWNNFGSWFGTNIGTPMKNHAINAVNIVVGAFSIGKEHAQKAWAPYGKWLNTNVFQPVKINAASAGLWIGNKLGEGKTWAQNHWASFTSWWGKNISAPVKGYASSAGSWIGQKYSEARQGVSNAWAGFSGWWSKYIGNPTMSVATDVGKWIGDKFSGARSVAESVWSDFSSWFEKHISGPVGKFIDDAKKRGESTTGLHPSKHANGTITTGPEISLIGEAGAEAIIPLSSSKRTRGLSLWQEAGRMLGVRMFADGGIANSSTGIGKLAKATANISTSIVLGGNDLNQFKEYGAKINANLSNGIDQTRQIATNSVNKVSTDNKNIMSLMANSGLTYGTEMVTELGNGIKDSEGNLLTIVNDLGNKVIDQFKTTFGIHSPSAVMRTLAGHIPEGFILGLQDTDMAAFIKKWIGDTSSLTQNGLGSVIGQLLQPMFTSGDNKGIISMVYNLVHNGLGSLFGGGGAVSGNVTEWLTAAIALTGAPMSWLPALEQIAMGESGGDPNSINLYDINAIEGHPSKGLMQLIDENMQDYHLPGMTDIYNPIENAAAAIKLIEHDYGTPFNTPGIRSMSHGGPYMGYATGTNNATPGVHLVGEKGPELVSFNGGEKVTPNNQLASISQQPYFAGGSDVKAEISPNITFNVYESKDPKATAQEIHKVLKQYFGDLFDEKMGTLKIQMGLS